MNAWADDLLLSLVFARGTLCTFHAIHRRDRQRGIVGKEVEWLRIENRASIARFGGAGAVLRHSVIAAGDNLWLSYDVGAMRM
jgi:hypothetical protein